MADHRFDPATKDTRVRRRFIGLYAILLLALAINMGSTLIDFGAAEMPARLAVAALMGALIALIFMRLREGTALIRLVAVVSLMWVVFLFALSFADYLTR